VTSRVRKLPVTGLSNMGKGIKGAFCQTRNFLGRLANVKFNIEKPHARH